MDEKLRLQDEERITTRRLRHLEGRGKSWLTVVVGMTLALWLWTQTYSHETKLRKVKLEAHIMSKCPDAKVCLEELVVPAMAEISDKVDFTLSFIGSTSPKDDAVKCMHGEDECLGNIILLCAANLYPDPKLYLGFTMCLTKEYPRIPEKDLVQGCALEHGIDFSELNDCASKDDGAFGMDLLRSSVTRTADANVTKSCTVRLDGDIRCIRDGGEWKDCPGGSSVEDLISDIKEARKSKLNRV